MKKILALVLVLAMALSMLAACGSTGGDDAGDGAETATVLKVGFDAEYPPYGYRAEDGSFEGFDIEMAKAVCELKGWDIELIPVEWAAKDLELESGAIDCIWSGFTINGREDDYAWSEPYADNSIVVLVKADSGITTLADLAGKKVGAQSGSSAYTLVAEGGDQYELGQTFGELIGESNYNTAFMELQAGSVDAVLVDVGVARYQVESEENGKFMILEEKASVEQYGIGFRVEDTALRDEVQDAVNQLVESGKYAELGEKYEISDNLCMGK